MKSDPRKSLFILLVLLANALTVIPAFAAPTQLPAFFVQNGFFEEENTYAKKAKAEKEVDKDIDFYSLTVESFNATFFLRLLINLISLVILIRFIYYPVYDRSDYFFTFFMFNVTIFIITYLLNTKSSFTVGAAFGLFAIFSMLRYRTEDISTRDMTYLFAAITLGLISSVNRGNMLEILVVNALILTTAFLLEGNWLIKNEFVKTIQYEKIENIKPEKRAELLADLKERTGLNIHRVNVKRIDFLRDTALVSVYYYGKKEHQV